METLILKFVVPWCLILIPSFNLVNKHFEGVRIKLSFSELLILPYNFFIIPTLSPVKLEKIKTNFIKSLAKCLNPWTSKPTHREATLLVIIYGTTTGHRLASPSSPIGQQWHATRHRAIGVCLSLSCTLSPPPPTRISSPPLSCISNHLHCHLLLLLSSLLLFIFILLLLL